MCVSKSTLMRGAPVPRVLGGTVNRLIRATAVVGAAALAVPLWAIPAQAQSRSATETASSVAYFSSTGISKPVEQLPSNPPQLISDSAADGVGPGNLGVAATAGRESKVSFVYFSLSDMPFGSKISKAVLTMKLAPEDSANRRANAAPKNVRACMPGDSGFGGQDGNNMENEAPERKCDAFQAAATATPDGTAYVFDVSGLAAAWDEMNDGVALTRTADSDAGFQVVFTPDAVLTYEFTPPPDDLDSSFDTGSTTTDVDSGFGDGGAGGGFDPGGFDAGSGSADFGGGFDAVASPLVGADLPAGPLPETAVEEPAVAAQTRAAPAAVLEQMRPTAGFWLAALLLAGGLALVSLVMGDPRTPAAAGASRPSRLSQALSSAQRGGGSSLLGTRSV